MLRSPHFNDIYYDEANGIEESMLVFIEGNHIIERIRSRSVQYSLPDFVVGELGFGTGLNALALWYRLNLVAMDNPALVLPDFHFYSVEAYPLPVSDCMAALQVFPQLGPVLPLFRDLYVKLASQQRDRWFALGSLLCDGALLEGKGLGSGSGSQARLHIHLYLGDVLDGIGTLPSGVDAWFPDGHDPAKNPQMWSEQVAQRMAALSPGRWGPSTLATWSAAGRVKQAYRDAGLYIVRRAGYGKKRHRIEGTYLGSTGTTAAGSSIHTAAGSPGGAALGSSGPTAL